MAQALADAKRKFSNATIVGILGSGHVEEGYGVPHQLRDLGNGELATFMPVTIEAACALVGSSYS